MSGTMTTDQEEAPEGDAPAEEAAQLSPEEEQDLWKQAVAGMKDEDGAIGMAHQAPKTAETSEKSESQPALDGENVEDGKKSEDAAEKTEEIKGPEPTDLPSEADVRLREAEEKAAALEARLAALEGRAPAAEKPADAAEPVDFKEKILSFLPKDLPNEKKEEVKTLLDYTEGLPTLVSALRETIRSEIFEKIRQDEAEKAAKADVSAKDAKYWGDLGNWFQSEYPEFKLEQIRADQKFTQWAKVNDAWISDQLNRTDRFDPSGARTVFQEYMKRAHPGTSKAQPKIAGTEKRMAAARTPASLSVRSPKAESTTSTRSLWEQEVAALKAKEAAAGKRYL